jgi:hypothetical protein
VLRLLLCDGVSNACWERVASACIQDGLKSETTRDIAREECRKLYEKRLTGLEEDLAVVCRTLEEYAHRM